ncbi:MAG: PHP domain-containing protein [Clostridia bacterium]|nr:PHP domain-containing protein [Clostridia bacterium]
MIRPDLHLHSTASDGTLSPAELVKAAGEAGLTVISLTDHDTFAGYDAVKETAGIELIPGIELSMGDMDGLHILCYGLTRAESLRQRVTDLAEKRLRRAERMCEKLEALGLPLDFDPVPGMTIGRMQIARAMIEKGYVRTVAEAFARYIGNDGPAYVASERMSIAEALPLIRRCGFVPVLAHPCELKVSEALLSQLLDRWMEMGLMGVEAYHPSSAGGAFRVLERMARERGLLVTGGSDFHERNDTKHGTMGCMLKNWHSAGEDVERLKAAMSASAGEQIGGQ